jgi:hypothetical protein
LYFLLKPPLLLLYLTLWLLFCESDISSTLYKKQDEPPGGVFYKEIGGGSTTRRTAHERVGWRCQLRRKSGWWRLNWASWSTNIECNDFAVPAGTRHQSLDEQIVVNAAGEL